MNWFYIKIWKTGNFSRTWHFLWRTIIMNITMRTIWRAFCILRLVIWQSYQSVTDLKEICGILIWLTLWSVMRMHTALPVRLSDRSKEVLILQHCMILRFLKNCLTMISRILERYLEKMDLPWSGITRGSMDMDRSSMRESVTVSVTLQRHLMERNVQKNLKRK